MRVLIVEDDAATARLYQRVLAEDGFSVDVAHTGEEGRLLAAVEPYDGVVLDLGLRDRHGLLVLADLRRAGVQVPVLVCTGRGEIDDVVRGLDAGADEYVVKPVATAELRARVRALVRRGGARRREQLALGNVVLNRLTRQVLVTGHPLALTPKEYALLEDLLLHAGEVVGRSALLERVWDLQFDPGSNVVDVHVVRVRRKLAAAGATVAVVTRRGQGFAAEALPGGAGADGPAEAGAEPAGR